MSKNWIPSLTYRRFVKKHYELNRLYWTQILGNRALQEMLKDASRDSLTIERIAPDLDRRKHMHSVEETLRWSNEYEERSRLHLLVICSANLESYLQEITFYHLINSGYAKPNSFKLNMIGEAIGRPILGKASLPEPLKYAQALFDLNFEDDLNVWRRSYKLRCAAAHNGGVVNARTLKDIPDLGQQLNEMIGLKWPLLKRSLESAENIAKAIDEKVTDKTLRLLEVKRELSDMKSIKQLPHRGELWTFVHEQLGLKGIPSKEKKAIESGLYDGDLEI